MNDWCKPKNQRVGIIRNEYLMKSNSVFLIALFSFFCISLNAQVFVGGNFGFNTSNDKTNNGATITNKSSDLSFALSPDIGKFLSEKIAIGFALDISLSENTSGVNPETITKSSSLGGGPFLRYYAMKWNKLSLFGQGNIGLAFSNSSMKAAGVNAAGPKGTRLNISIYPGLSFDINDKLSLETSLHIFSFGYSYLSTINGSDKDKVSGFHIGAGLDNIVSIGAITIGAIYKF